MIGRILTKIQDVAAFLLSVLAIRFNKAPIRTLDALIEFIHTRAAYVAQTSLYGYVKTRMGTRYPLMFQDEVFAASINTAKWRVFAACLADLTVFAVARTAAGGRLGGDEAARLAQVCLAAAVRRTFDADVSRLAAETVAAMAERSRATNWGQAAIEDGAFAQSPAELVRSAPIADELKQFDRGIVETSIRLRWRDVRDQVHKRLDADSVIADWRDGAGDGLPGH